MKNFAAIDFETANSYRSSVCSVGIVIVRDSKIVDSFYSLIHPTPDEYNPRCVAVHGLTYKDTDGAPNFKDVWSKVEPKIKSLTLVAHNKAFDESCLKAVFRTYGMDYPDYDFKCTLIAARKKLRLAHYTLDNVLEAVEGPMQNHHHALADAEACAKIAIKLIDDED